MPAPTPQLLTVDQFAAALGISKRTAYRLIEARAIDVVNVGVGATKTRISVEAVRRFIDARTTSGRK
jgi:excisionase family DNA binding protein